MPRDDQNELFVVVDKDDNILTHKTRYECHHNKNLIHRGIGVIIFNDKEEVLLQKRSKYKDLFPRYYTISTGGHVAKGESYEDAALRELREEIGIQTEIKFRSKFLMEYSQVETEMDSIYTAIHNGPFKIDPTEVEKVEFFSKDQIRQMVDKLTPFAKRGLQEINIL